MTHVSIRNITTVALAVFVLLAVLNIAGFFFHARSDSSRQWAAHSFSGTVVAVSPGLLKIKDVHGEHMLFRLTDTTVVRRGNDIVTTAALVPGTYIVIDSATEEGTLTARTVRVILKEFSSPKK